MALGEAGGLKGENPDKSGCKQSLKGAKGGKDVNPDVSGCKQGGNSGGSGCEQGGGGFLGLVGIYFAYTEQGF